MKRPGDTPLRSEARIIRRVGALFPNAIAVAVVLAFASTGCRTFLPPLPAADLKEPGWTVREGQAVWHLPRGESEIAGELLVATRTNGQTFVQFAKSPFPIVTAQTTDHRWQADFPPQGKHYAGRGMPPQRIIWFQLPRVLRNEPPPKDLSWHQDDKSWRLENRKAGESVEGYFNP